MVLLLLSHVYSYTMAQGDKHMLKDTSGQDRFIKPNERVKRHWWILGALAFLLIAAGAATLPALGSLFSADMTVSRERLRVATVEQGDLQRDISVQGKIVASNSPTLYARAAGIVSLQVKAGDSVTQGQVLARIESPELDNSYAQALAVLEQQSIEVERYQIQMKTDLLNAQQNIEVSQVNLEAARVNQRRAKMSVQDNLISQREFEEKVVALKQAELAHKHASQQFHLSQERMAFELKSRESELSRQGFAVNDLKRQLDELTSIAPADGIIGSVNVRQQDQVAANSPLITLIDLSAFEVEVNIPENYADDLGVGLDAEISFNGITHLGDIVAISPEVTNGQVVGRIRFSQSGVANLRQNQRVSARILIESKQDVLKVRRGAFVESGGGRVTYLVRGDTAVRAQIQVGARSLSEVELLSGVKAGDQIIISSLDDIKQQQQIYLTN